MPLEVIYGIFVQMPDASGWMFTVWMFPCCCFHLGTAYHLYHWQVNPLGHGRILSFKQDCIKENVYDFMHPVQLFDPFILLPGGCLDLHQDDTFALHEDDKVMLTKDASTNTCTPARLLVINEFLHSLLH